MIKAKGFALYDTRNREIFVNTVHGQKQQAMVNSMVVVHGFITPQSWQFQAVQAKWNTLFPDGQFLIVPVDLTTDGKEAQ